MTLCALFVLACAATLVEDEIVFHDMKSQAPTLSGSSRPLSAFCQYPYQYQCGSGGGGDRNDSGLGGQAGVQFVGGSRPGSPSSPLFVTQQQQMQQAAIGVGYVPGSSRPGSPSYNPLGAPSPHTPHPRALTPGVLIWLYCNSISLR